MPVANGLYFFDMKTAIFVNEDEMETKAIINPNKRISIVIQNRLDDNDFNVYQFEDDNEVIEFILELKSMIERYKRLKRA